MHVQNLKLSKTLLFLINIIMEMTSYISCKPVFWPCKELDRRVSEIYCLISKKSKKKSNYPKSLIISQATLSFGGFYKIYII